MASANSIMPFPADIDRNAFGHWLSGFTDGEGTFGLLYRHHRKWRCKSDRCEARFRINLRADDGDILTMIQSYWQAGWVSRRYDHHQKWFRNANPQIVFTAYSIADLKIVVSHFERYPLRAKKMRDFEIWKRGIALIVAASERPWRRDGNRGLMPRWTSNEREQFMQLKHHLEAVRKFDSHETPIQETPISTAPIPRRPNLVLFD